MARATLGVLLVALLLCLPASAGASSRADRVAAADAFARRTAHLADRLAASRVRARRAQAARRTAARACLPAWADAPLSRRDDLATIYFEALSGALWSVHGPLFGSWVSDLRGSARVRRSPVLRRGAAALRRQVRGANEIYGLYPDPCAVVTAWRGAGWSDAARPAGLAVTDDLGERFPEADARAVAEAAHQVAVYGRFRRRTVAELLSTGVDEPDALVTSGTSCDPVGALVAPSEYECPPATGAPR